MLIVVLRLIVDLALATGLFFAGVGISMLCERVTALEKILRKKDTES